jgi:hypothetical protein
VTNSSLATTIKDMKSYQGSDQIVSGEFIVEAEADNHIPGINLTTSMIR